LINPRAPVLVCAGAALWWLASVQAIDGRPLVVVWNDDPEVYDPQATSHPVSESVFRHACEPLYTEGAPGQLNPVVASGPPVFSDDGLRVSVPLRADRRFHSGAPVDADAVAGSFERIKRLGISPLAGQLRSVETVADGGGVNAVTFHMLEPDFEFPRLVLSSSYAAVVNPAAGDSAVPGGALPDCTGAYAFKQELYRPDKELTLVRVRGDGVRFLTFRFIAEAADRFDALVNGSACVLSVDGEEAARLAEIGGFELFDAIGGVTFVGFNMQKPRWQDRRLRAAFSHAIDKQGLAGDGPFFLAHTPLSPSAVGYDPAVATSELEFDPERAALYLDESGFDDRVGVTILVPESRTYSAIAERLVEQLRRIGVTNVNQRTVSREDILTRRQDFDLLLFDYAWGDYTALAIFLGQGPRNLLGYAGGDLVELLSRAQRTADPVLRAELIATAQRSVLEQALWQPALVRRIVFAVNTQCVTGVTQGLFGELDFDAASTGGSMH
jgi:peptide/nickel transport system substrate-binding protein